jgi:hypothetical protein
MYFLKQISVSNTPFEARHRTFLVVHLEGLRFPARVAGRGRRVVGSCAGASRFDDAADRCHPLAKHYLPILLELLVA